VSIRAKTCMGMMQERVRERIKAVAEGQASLPIPRLYRFTYRTVVVNDVAEHGGKRNQCDGER